MLILPIVLCHGGSEQNCDGLMSKLQEYEFHFFGSSHLFLMHIYNSQIKKWKH